MIVLQWFLIAAGFYLWLVGLDRVCRGAKQNEAPKVSQPIAVPLTDEGLRVRQQVLASLEPLFAEARAKGLWFHSCYQDMWFSPDELAEMHRQDRFIWGPVNWTLRNPRGMPLGSNRPTTAPTAEQIAKAIWNDSYEYVRPRTVER